MFRNFVIVNINKKCFYRNFYVCQITKSSHCFPKCHFFARTFIHKIILRGGILRMTRILIQMMSNDVYIGEIDSGGLQKS